MKGERRKLAARMFAAARQYQYVLLILCAGVGLLVLPFGGGKKGQDTQSSLPAEQTAYSLEQTQERLEELLSQMDGVGRASVMLTVASGTQRVYQDDRALSYRGSTSAPEDYDSHTETVLLNRGSAGQEALQTQEIYPDYVGAVVVCDGAGSSAAVLKIKEAVSVLTGLGTDHISVVQRSES